MSGRILLRAGLLLSIALVGRHAYGENPRSPYAFWHARVAALSGVSLSPEGSQVLFWLRYQTDPGPARPFVWDVAASRLQPIDIAAAAQSVWGKNDDELLVLAPDEGGSGVWSWTPRQGRASLLFSHEQAISKLLVSQDGDTVLFTVNVAESDSAESARKTQAALKTTGLIWEPEVRSDALYFQRHRELWTWNRRSGQKQKVYEGNFAESRLALSPDGTVLAWSGLGHAIVTSFTGTWHAEPNVWTIDLQRGVNRPLRQSNRRSDRLLGWSPDGRALLIDTDPLLDPGPHAFATLRFHHAAHSIEAWTLDRASGDVSSVAQLAGNLPPRKGDLDWWTMDSGGRMCLPVETSPGRTSIGRAAAEGLADLLPNSPWCLTEVAFSRSGKRAACVRETINDPPELALVDLESRSLRTLTALNRAVAETPRPRVDYFPVTNGNGISSANFLIRPSLRNPPQKSPLIILLYSFKDRFSTRGQWIPNYAPYDYAEMGCHVLLANYPAYDGASGPGRVTVAERMRFGIGLNPLESLKAAVNLLVAEGGVDPSRIALSGFSFGGFITQYALTHSSLFSAAVIIDGGRYNPIQYYTNGAYDLAEAAIYDTMFGGPPFSAGADAWREFSPAFRAGKIRCPVLFETHVAGPRPAALDFVLEAKLGGAPLELVQYDGTHVLKDATQQRSSMERIRDFFAYWLLDAENPTPRDSDQYTRWKRMKEGRPQRFR